MIKRIAFKVLIYSLLIILDVQSATLQFKHFMASVQTFMADRVIFEQFRERLIQSLQMNRSIDLGSLQELLDFYGIRQQVVSKNEAIELILKAYHAKNELLRGQDLPANVLQINQELPVVASHIEKFDFRFMNEAAGFTFLANAPRGVENHAITFQGQNFSAGLSLRPMCARPTVYELMAQDYARRDNLRFLIEHDPKVYLEYRIQRTRCIEQIKRMLDLSNSLDALTAQVSVNNLFLWDAYEEGVILTDWVKPGIQNLLFKNGNFIAIDTQERLGQLLAIADKFFKETLPKEEYIQLLQEYTRRVIPGADILLKRALGINGYWDAIKTYFKESFSFFPAMIDSEVAQSRMIQNCVKIVELCKDEKFDEARKIIASLQAYTNEDSKYRINEAHYLSLLVENEYSRVFNSYGIRYTDTIDPYYPVAKHILDACPYTQKHELQKAIQETIKERSAQLHTLLRGATSAQKKSLFIKAVGYKILDAQNTNEMVDILSSFAKDHTDENARNAYSVFVSYGFPSFLSANECAKNFRMPVSIETMGNEDIRKWYGYCAGLQIETNEQKELVNRSLEHLSLACKENPYRDDHLYMAQRFYADATSGSEEKLFLKMPNLACHDTASINGQLEREVLRKSCESFRNTPDEKEIPQIIEKANRVVGCIQSGKVRTIQDVEQVWNAQDECTVLSGPSEIYPEKELEVVEEEFTPPYGCGTSFLDEFQRAFFDFTHEVFDWEEPYGGACFPGSERAKSLFDPETQEIEEGIDVDSIPQCNGGQQTLPAFGDSTEEAEEGGENKKTEKNQDSEEVKKNESEIIENIIKKALEDKKLTDEQLSNIEEFRVQLSDLIKEYGKDNVFEASEIYEITLHRICNRGITAIKKLSKILQIINEDELTKSFKFDPAQNYKVTASSVEEALAGRECMVQKLLGLLKRALEKEDDFTEVEPGVNWDVKTPRSESLEGKRIFDIVKIIRSLRIAYDKGENLIINITNLNNDDTETLYQEIKKEFSEKELIRTVVVHAEAPSKSKNKEQFVEFMRNYVCSNRVQ